MSMNFLYQKGVRFLSPGLFLHILHYQLWLILSLATPPFETMTTASRTA